MITAFFWFLTDSRTRAHERRTSEASILLVRVRSSEPPPCRSMLLNRRLAPSLPSREYAFEVMRRTDRTGRSAPGSRPSDAGSDVAQRDPPPADERDHLDVAPQRPHVPAQRGDEVVAPPLEPRQLRLRHRGVAGEVSLGFLDAVAQ